MWCIRAYVYCIGCAYSRVLNNIYDGNIQVYHVWKLRIFLFMKTEKMYSIAIISTPQQFSLRSDKNYVSFNNLKKIAWRYEIFIVGKIKLLFEKNNKNKIPNIYSLLQKNWAIYIMENGSFNIKLKIFFHETYFIKEWNQFTQMAS